MEKRDFSRINFVINVPCIMARTYCGFARRVLWQAERRETMMLNPFGRRTETSYRDFISRSVEIHGASNRAARSLATRWKMSLRGRTDDDDRFCRRSLLLFLIFLWWPYVPSLYHFLSLVIPVLHIFSLSLLLLDFLSMSVNPRLGVALETACKVMASKRKMTSSLARQKRSEKVNDDRETII